MQRAESSRSDLCFSRATFRNDEGRPLSVKLTFDSLGHRELRVIKGIARVLRDKVIDGQHFIGEGFTGRVKEGHELIADAVCNGNAKGIEIFRNIVDFLEPIRKARNSAGDLDVPGLQAFLQHLHNIFVLWFQCQHPCVDPLFLRNDLQLLEISAVLERCEYIVLKRGDERHCCFVVQFLEQARTISFRAEDVAFAWLLRFFAAQLLHRRFACHLPARLHPAAMFLSGRHLLP